MIEEISKRNEIFPRLRNMVPSLLHLPGDVTRLVSPESSHLGKCFCFVTLDRALPFLSENPHME